MEFYHNIITEKSFKLLLDIKRKYDFILIGGWAVFLYSRSLKSKDIDIIVDFDELSKIQESYELFKNERLKKYEIKFQEIDVDIYVPHYSFLGVDIAAIKNNIVSRDGFKLPALEMLFLLKLYVWQERAGTVKGRKDEIDALSIAFLSEFNWQKYLNFTKELKFEKYHQKFISLINNIQNIKELNINNYQMSKKRKEITARISI